MIYIYIKCSIQSTITEIKMQCSTIITGISYPHLHYIHNDIIMFTQMCHQLSLLYNEKRNLLNLPTDEKITADTKLAECPITAHEM